MPLSLASACLLARRPLTLGVARQARLLSHGGGRFGAPKGGPRTGPDDRVVSAVVPSKLFLLTVFNGKMVLDSIYNRVCSTGVAIVFVLAVILFWGSQPVFSFLGLFAATFLALLLALHAARSWLLIPYLAWLLYKFLF
eukprot:EG_transcript_16259